MSEYAHLRLADRIDARRRPVDVLFVGINPGVRSALTGHHFAGPSNRFWKLLYESRLVPEPVTFEDDDRLPEWGLGITNLVARPTPGVADLSRAELRAGRAALERKILRHRPRMVAAVGIMVYRALFPEEKIVVTGRSARQIGGTTVWVLPNPSGRNANFSYDEMLSAFRSLQRHVARNRPVNPSRR